MIIVLYHRSRQYEEEQEEELQRLAELKKNNLTQQLSESEESMRCDELCGDQK